MVKLTEVRRIIENALAEGRRMLYEFEAKKVLSLYGVPTPRFEVASDPEEAVKISERIGFPVALKIISPDIIHKSDVNGVLLNIGDEEGVERAFNLITSSVRKAVPRARILGVLVEEMGKPGVEVAVGAIKDKYFGPVIMFGLGGILIEVFKDVSFRIAPLTEIDAKEMIEEIKGKALLHGFRGQRPRDLKTLIEILLSISKLITEIELINQLDLNPILSYEKGALVVDARIII